MANKNFDVLKDFILLILCNIIYCISNSKFASLLKLENIALVQKSTPKGPRTIIDQFVHLISKLDAL